MMHKKTDFYKFYQRVKMSSSQETIKYKFKEDFTLRDIKKYIESTYSSHYSGNVQPTELIISSGHGEGFCLGNMIKYSSRCGKKASTTKKSDILKVIHYSIILYNLVDES